MAIVALTLMACGNSKNGAEMPAKDKQAVENATSGALNQIGKSQAEFDKFLTDAGFLKVESSLGAPAKHLQAKHKAPAAKDASTVEVEYVYGLTLAEYSMTDQSAIAARQNEILKKGNTIIVIYAAFSSNKLMMVEASMAVAANKKANTFYTGISDKYLATIPSDAVQSSWSGALGAKAENVYQKHDEFVAAIAAAESGVTAAEMGYALMNPTTYDGFGYITNWLNPDADQIAKQAEQGYDPYAIASCAGMDMMVLLALMQE